MKHTFSLIYHSEQTPHFPTRDRVAYLLRAARSRGLNHRPRVFPGIDRDILLPNIATLFRHPRPSAIKAA